MGSHEERQDFGAPLPLWNEKTGEVDAVNDAAGGGGYEESPPVRRKISDVEVAEQKLPVRGVQERYRLPRCGDVENELSGVPLLG